MNYDKTYLYMNEEVYGKGRFYVEDGEGFHMDYYDFFNTYIKGKMCDSSFRRRLKAGQSVAEALARKRYKKPNVVDEKKVNEYLRKHLDRYKNTVLDARKVKSAEELIERLHGMGYEKCSARLVVGDETFVGEANEFYVITVGEIGDAN